MKSSFLMLLSIVVAMIFVLLSEQLGGESMMARVMLGYSVAIFVFILLDSALDPKSSLLMMVVAFYHCGMFLLPGMFHVAQGWFPFFSARYNVEDIQYVSLLVGLYSTGVLAGYIMGRPRDARTRRAFTDQYVEPAILDYRTSDSRVIIIAFLSLSVSVVCVAAIGWEQFVARRGDFDLTGFELTPLNVILLNIPRAASFCAAVILAERMVAQRSMPMLIVCLPVFVCAYIANNPITLPRYYFFSLLFVLVYSSGRIVSARAKIGFLAFLFVGLFVLLPLTNTLSRGGIGETFAFEPMEYLSTHGDFDGLQSTLSTYLMVQRDGITYGWHLMSSIFTFVPRELWPTKAYATGQSAGEAMGFDFVNLSAPLPAEIYVDFGIVGILFIPFWIGFAIRRLDRKAQRALLSRSPMVSRLFYGGLIGYATIICRGSLESVLSPVYLYFGIVAVWYFANAQASGRSAVARSHLRRSRV